MSFIQNIIRKNINDLKPYSSARNEFSGQNAILLDANENPFNEPFNRYPDPLQIAIKQKIIQNINLKYNFSPFNQLSIDNIFLGNGSDEAIDLLIRAFCEPQIDNIISPDPSYGMYEVCAGINNVDFRKVLLANDFQLDPDAIRLNIDNNTKIIFICSPNNPTSNSFIKNDIISIIETFNGIVVIDEAYIDFSVNEGFLPMLQNYPNLVVIQTLSKSKALAGIRLGMAFAGTDIIAVLNKIKYPYNINFLTQNFLLDAFNKNFDNNKYIDLILKERSRLQKELLTFDFIEKIYPSDANFLLVKMKNHHQIFSWLLKNNIVVRDRSRHKLCDACLRITIGNPQQNDALLNALNMYKLSISSNF